jgi:hypothetical protein
MTGDMHALCDICDILVLRKADCVGIPTGLLLYMSQPKTTLSNILSISSVYASMD